MRHLTRLFLAIGCAVLLQGCQGGLPGFGPSTEEGVTPNAVLGGEIEVVALDAPPPDPTATAAPPGAAATAAPQATATAPAGETAPEPAPVPEPATDPAEAAEDAAEAAPAAPKSEAQLACERARGQWTPTGTGTLRTCIFTTRDSGKRCTRESQCEGACLARSGTCSPIRPLLGCNEILQDNGARVTQCIE